MEAEVLAERKTAVMRAQNRLQQAFARLLKPGQSVLEWSFETDTVVAEWPPLCRATAHVRVADRDFVGEWAKGQRNAQLSVCTQIMAFLDGEHASEASQSKNGGAAGGPTLLTSRLHCCAAKAPDGKVLRVNSKNTPSPNFSVLDGVPTFLCSNVYGACV